MATIDEIKQQAEAVKNATQVGDEWNRNDVQSEEARSRLSA